jgi:NAD(P)-dependent dehydrogenase (short-subunit alcohol dehydrogenase family)
MSGRLNGKVCIISGIGAGIGRATTLLFSREGGTIVGCDIELSGAEETAQEVRKSGGKIEVFPRASDLTNFAECEAFVAFAQTKFGRFHVLFNNAARMYHEFMDEMTTEIWDNCIKCELDIAFYLCLAAWPALIRGGGGSIINVGSVRGQRPSPNFGNVAHMAAKAGVIAMSQQMALEGGRHNIRVNTVSPGQAGGRQGKALYAEERFHRATAPLRVLGRHGRPDDVANYVLFLASDESSFVTGTDLLVDGGSSIATTASVRFTPDAMPS